ncbi:MAG: SRPBCC family protein [Myxococcaceae bacterium]|nr:SRPBCC family protein [Myxococcaceae bacterium]
MPSKSFSALSTAAADTLWSALSDVSSWPSWDESIARASLDGPFVTGTGGTLALHGQPPLGFTLTEVTAGRSFTNEARVGPMTVRFHHTLERLSGGARLTHGLDVDGPGAEALLERLAPGVEHALESLARLGSNRPRTLGGVILYTRDVAKKVAFYEAAFGVEVLTRAPGNVYVQLAGAVPLGFTAESFAQTALPLAMRPSQADAPPPALELMFVVADVPAAFQRAVKAGAAPVLEPVTKPWGQEVSYVRDDDGVLVELCSPWA